VGLLEIKGGNFRLTPKTLSCVRSFAVGEVVLGDMARERGGVLDVEDPNVEDRMSELLEAEVNALVRVVVVSLSLSCVCRFYGPLILTY
jgi:hypothetical protein